MRKNEKPVVDAGLAYSHEALMSSMGIGRQTLQQLISRGWVTPVRVGRRVFFSGRQVVEAIEAEARKDCSKTGVQE